MLDIQIFDGAGRLTSIFTDDPETYDIDVTDDELDVEVGAAVHYVSTINAGSYGPPALIAPAPTKPGGKEPSRARIGETVLYINTSLVPVYAATRVSD